MLKYRLYKLLRLFRLISKKKYKKKVAPYLAIFGTEYKAIARSKFFDAQWYLEHNPDVKKAKVDPIHHFLDIGWKECREWTPYFNIKEYVKMYPDVAKSNMNPLLHWELHGKFEDRYAETTPKKICFGKKITDVVHKFMVYPQTVYDEYQKLSLELKNIK